LPASSLHCLQAATTACKQPSMPASTLYCL
jgi:hypothetical protein